MQYLWESFNIKTFPAWTLVFIDGNFNTDLSSLPENMQIKQSQILIGNYDNKLPIHIIYVGELVGEHILKIKNKADNAKIFCTSKIKNKKPAGLNVLIENAGKNSTFEGKCLFQNNSVLRFNVFAGNFAKNTGNFITTKVVAHKESETYLSGTEKIERGLSGCDSKMSFSALCSSDIKKMSLTPNQNILSEPRCAEHSSSIWRGTDLQIEYLREAGMSAKEIESALTEAFENFL